MGAGPGDNNDGQQPASPIPVYAQVPSQGMTCAWCGSPGGSGPLTTLPWIGPISGGNWSQVFHNGGGAFPARGGKRPGNCYGAAKNAGLVD